MVAVYLGSHLKMYYIPVPVFIPEKFQMNLTFNGENKLIKVLEECVNKLKIISAYEVFFFKYDTKIGSNREKIRTFSCYIWQNSL